MRHIDSDHIQIVDGVNNYKEAINLASKPLLKREYIASTYVEAMIQAIEKYGPYIVLQDEFAMPHASPAEGVHKTGLALLIVRNGVDLLGHNVKVFLVLAPETKDALNAILTEFAEFLMNKQNVKNLYNAKDVESIQNLLEESW